MSLTLPGLEPPRCRKCVLRWDASWPISHLMTVKGRVVAQTMIIASKTGGEGIPSAVGYARPLGLLLLSCP